MKRKTRHGRELAILRKAVDRLEKHKGQAFLRQPSTKQLISIVEEFIRAQQLVCYGGTAINNILPAGSQFYDKTAEVPDYDFFSPNALKDARALADMYASKGYTEVEAKAGIHFGTYKVFVDFVPVADVTNLPRKLFTALKEKSIVVDGIRYAPPDYLRMSMYLELSRPQGDTSRWEKVLRRLMLLNEHYPMQNPRCTGRHFARKFEGGIGTGDKIFRIVKNSAAKQQLVFFGSYAASMYSGTGRKRKIPDFDLLSPDPKISAEIMVDDLERAGLHDVRTEKHQGLGEVIPEHYQVSVGDDIVAFIYQTVGCHNYNPVLVHKQEIRIATIDTMLSLYLAFLYDDSPYHDPTRIYCMAQYLFQTQGKNRLRQVGVLKRFVPTCIGTQDTKESVRSRKAAMHRKLVNGKNSAAYQAWFLNYQPKATKRTLKKHKKQTLKKKKR